MEDRKSWERRKGERSKAYSAFCLYRNLGPRGRSLTEAASLYYATKGKPKVYQLKRWSVRYNWVERCEAFDDFIDEQKRQKYLDDQLKMADRQASLGCKLQELGEAMLDDLLVKKETVKGNILDIVRSLRTGTEFERLGRGAPTQIVEEQGKERDVVVIQWRGEKEEEGK